MIEPELTNELAARQWQFLCDKCGENTARWALARAVKRGRRAFPLNAARELGIKLPPAEQLPPLPPSPAELAQARAQAREYLHKLRASLAGQ